MKKSNFALFIIIFVFMMSCKNIYYSGNSLEPGITFTGSSNASLELYVDTTSILKGSSTTTVTFGIFKRSDNVFSDAYIGGNADLEKRAAMYKALQNTNYDLIVLPKYKIEAYRGLFTKRTTCFVEGYGGKYMLRNVKYISNNSKATNSNNSIATKNPISKEEIKIDSLKNTENFTSIKYNSIEEVSIGDIVSFKGYSNELIFGIVIEIGTKNKIKMRTYPTPGQELIIEDRYSWFKKIVH